MGNAIRATILIPSYDHAAFVVDAVRSALAQTEPDVEVLVIDDGSTDDSVARLAALQGDPRLTLLTQDNVGLSRTLNRGLSLARGRWVKFLPSDDFLAPECIARQLAAAESVPGCGVVFALPRVVDASGVPLADPAPQAWFDDPPGDRDAMLRGLLERNFLCAPSALFDRELALAVGGFDPALRVAQDYDLWLKLLVRAPAVMVRERLVSVRWHGANQSATVTPATEAERARVVVGALERGGLETWIELFRSALGDGAEASASTSSGVAPAGAATRDARARADLAAALRRSALREVEPFLAQLALAQLALDGAGSAEPQPSSAPRRRLATALRGVARRLGALASRAAPDAVVSSIGDGPRREHWLIVEPGATARGDGRSLRLASALADAHTTVTAAAPALDDDAAATASRTGLRIVPRDLAALRSLVGDHDQRLRIVVQRPQGEVIALVREARLVGARVLYDKAEGWGSLARADIDSERALIDAADDLIGTTRPLVKQLAVSRRLVHLLPDPEDAAGWADRARSLRTLAARPTVTVAVSCGVAHASQVVDAFLADLQQARGDLPYRIAVVDDGVAPALLDALLAREEAQEITLLRNALRGRASGHNLALRATTGEIVVLLDATTRVPGPGWLDAPLRALLERRALGAVAAPGRDPGDPWTWVVPRAVLRRTGGFGEEHDPAGFEDADLVQRLRALGYQVGDWSALGPAPHAARAVVAPDVLRRSERRFRRRWRRSAASVVLGRPTGEV